MTGSNHNIQDIYELSPLQQGMLFYTLKNPDAGMYVVQLACLLQGELETAVFQEAWQRMVERHPIFRTAFFWKEAEKQLQVVYKQCEPPLEQLDWRDFPAEEQATRLETFLEADRRRGFEFSRAPLMRLTLIRLAGDLYRFIWSYHHVLLDGWSLSQVLQEFFIFYETILQDEHYPMPATNPYRDYINWLQQQDRSRAETFWRGQLQGITGPTPLVMEDANLGVEQALEIGIEHGELEIQLPVETTAALQRLVQKNRLTMNTMVQGAWALLLSRYSGEQDVVFGTIVSGRPASLPGVESIVGPFINTLPLRVHLDPALSTLSWLQQLNGQQVEMRDYEYSALVDVQGWSEVPRGQPLFETSVVFENYPLEASLQDEQLSLKISELRDIERTNFSLGLLALPGPRLMLKIAYDVRRFKAETVGRMLARLELLLEAIKDDCEQPLGELPFLLAEETQQLLGSWNETAVPYLQGECIHHLFEAQVARTPEATAVTFEERDLTYTELNGQANRLARYLQREGVGPETLVGINIPRSPEMVVAVLAVLKAGGAYLPLDPDYPDSRLPLILEDTQVALIVTQQRLAAELASYPVRLFCLDVEDETLAEFSADNLEVAMSADNLAYIIYTSGSTGTPKGVAVAHDGLANLVTFQQAWFSVGPGSQVLQSATLNFDGSVWEILPSLCNGATVHLATLETVITAPSLIALLQERGITIASLPPALLSTMSPAVLPALQTLISVGEACPPAVLAQWAPGRRFFNGYGPTESTVAVTAGELQADDPLITIGRPLPNKKVYVLDERQQLVPTGAAGELCIGGVGLARGYLHRPDITAERFIPNPFSDEPGGRLYRSGDLVRYLPDGRLEYLGRIDNQVKIRGFRIELGEVETALNRHPDILESAVIAREDNPGNKRLVAYYRAGKESGIEPEIVRNYLRTQLPPYMIPAAFMPLAAFPLTANGKVDRRALPTPVVQRSRRTLVAPRTEMERTLAAIWQEVLEMERVGIEDNFFDLGGHSLLMMRVNGKLQNSLKRDVPMVALFQYPTIKTLAEHLAGDGADNVIEQTRDRVARQKEALRRRKKRMQTRG